LNRLLLLAVTADFVDCIKEKHVKILLALHIMKNHNEKKQFAVFLLILQDYNIIKKLRVIVADNFNINDILC